MLNEHQAELAAWDHSFYRAIGRYPSEYWEPQKIACTAVPFISALQQQAQRPYSQAELNLLQQQAQRGPYPSQLEMNMMQGNQMGIGLLGAYQHAGFLGNQQSGTLNEDLIRQLMGYDISTQGRKQGPQ